MGSPHCRGREGASLDASEPAEKGARLTTYVITGERGTGVTGINGAVAHLVKPGDLTIIMAFRQVPDTAVADHVPTCSSWGRGRSR